MEPFFQFMQNRGFFPEGMKVREIPIIDSTGKNLHLEINGSITPKGQSSKKKLPFKIGKVVWGQQSDDREKVILIEEIQWDDGRKELRFGYWTQTHDEGTWRWGQFALMVPIEDIQELLKMARDKGLLSI